MPNLPKGSFMRLFSFPLASKKGSRLLRYLYSVLLGLPFLVAYGCLDGEGDGHYDYAIVLIILWLMASPHLVFIAGVAVNRYLDRIRPAMQPEDWEDYQKFSLREFYSNRSLLVIPALGTVLLAPVVLRLFEIDAPTAKWVFVCSLIGAMAITASLGFWGLLTSNFILGRLSRYPLKINPGHLDSYGGLRCVSRFLITSTTLFYSGSFAIPFAVRIIDDAGGELGTFLGGLALTAFVGFGVANFAYGVLKVSDKVFEEKVNLSHEIEANMDKMLEPVRTEDQPDLATVIRPWVYGQLVAREVETMRTYPYDWRTITELSISALIPVLVFLLDRFLQSG